MGDSEEALLFARGDVVVTNRKSGCCAVRVDVARVGSTREGLRAIQEKGSHLETLIIYKLISRKFTAQNDLH